MPTHKHSIIKRLLNRILHHLARLLPGRMTIRPFLHRLRGVKIAPQVAIGDDVYLENEHPEAVEIAEGVHIAMRCTIIAHTRGVGKIVIEKNAFIGAGSIIICNSGRVLTIGEGAVIAAGSNVTQSVEPFIFCGPPKLIVYGRATVPLTSNNHAAFVRGLRPIQQSINGNKG